MFRLSDFCICSATSSALAGISVHMAALRMLTHTNSLGFKASAPHKNLFNILSYYKVPVTKKRPQQNAPPPECANRYYDFKEGLLRVLGSSIQKTTLGATS